MSRIVPLVLFIFACAGAVAAQERGRSMPRESLLAGADYRDQGEYLGQIVASNISREWTGLQVVALGGEQFQASMYRGGLPGYGAIVASRRELKGARKDGSITLADEGCYVVIDDGTAHFFSPIGVPLGNASHVERLSHTLGVRPPTGARVLFDGTDRGELSKPRLTDEGLLQVGTETVRPYKDFRMHLEFRTPFMPEARGQGRGNSGVYIQGRYEVQILDSFGLQGVENECGGLYKTRAPDVNMCLPPESWQTYDIDFRAARFDDCGQRVQQAQITVWHNGISVHTGVAIPNKTGGGAVEGPDARPIKLQDHGNPVEFRNIWIVEHAETVAPACPTVYVRAKSRRR